MTLAVAIIAILPMLIKRSEHADNNIPALYLYGATGTGKSFFFFTNPRYKGWVQTLESLRDTN